MATLKQWLSESGLTQQAFADMIGASQSAVAKYLGGRKPRERYIDKIYKETHGAVTANDFYGHVCADKRRAQKNNNRAGR